MDEITPNEIARTLSVTGLTFRNWLRSEKAAGHPLLAGHEYRSRYRFTRAEADQLIAEYRASQQRTGTGAGPACGPAGDDARIARNTAGEPSPIGAPIATRSRGRGDRRASAVRGPGPPRHRGVAGRGGAHLADLLRSGLRAVIVGINPSPVSVAAGHYYQGANGKRWWAALREAGILPDGDGWEDDRLFAAGIGFTDLVKRATARETGLHPGEREHGRKLLQERLDGLGVERVLFVYKSSARELLGPFPGWGLRPGRPVAGAKAWVMCGPMAPGADRVKAIGQLRAWWRG